jgi:hypothetical protein
MNTYAIQLELHFQSKRTDDRRFDTFVEELKVLAAKHGISFGDYQSMQLRSTDYTIGPCSLCGHLTIDHANLRPVDQNMLPDFWFYIRHGNLAADVLTCSSCGPIARAT